MLACLVVGNIFEELVFFKNHHYSKRCHIISLNRLESSNRPNSNKVFAVIDNIE